MGASKQMSQLQTQILSLNQIVIVSILEKLLGYDKIDFFHIKLTVSLLKYFILFFKNQNLLCIQANNITLTCKFKISDKGENIQLMIFFLQESNKFYN